MKKAKKLYILLGILAVICLLTFLVSRQEEKKEKIKNSDEVILKIDSDDVTELSWETEKGNLAFHKEDSWVYDEDEKFPVNEKNIEKLLKTFEKFEVSFIIEDVDDYAQYGLDDPLCNIQVKAKDKTYKIEVGDYSKMDEERYVSIGDGNVYLVKDDPLETFSLELKDMIEDDEIPDLSETKAIQYEGKENYQIVYEKDSQRTYCKDDVYFKKDGNELLPLDTLNVKAYLDAVTNLNFGQYMTYNATEEELAQYGLDQPDLTMTMQYEVTEDEKDEDAKVESKEFVLHISQDPKEKNKKTSDDEEEEITAYARVGNSKIIYKIAGEDYETLMKAGYNELRHQEVFTGDMESIKSVDISLDGNAYTLNTKKEDEKTVWYYNDQKIEGEDFENALSGLEISKFTNEKPELKEEISLTIHLDHKTYPEVTIEIYRYDGKNCLAVLDGEPLALLDREHVVELTEAVNAIVLNEENIKNE